MINKEHSLSCFTASFRQGFTSPNVPLVTLHQNDKELIFMLDSGSEYNVIDKDVLASIEHEVVQDDTMPKKLSGVGGVTETSGCSIKFRCGDEEYSDTFLVNDLSAPLAMLKKETGVIMHGIIGSKFMRDHNIVLDYQTLMAYSKK